MNELEKKQRTINSYRIITIINIILLLIAIITIWGYKSALEEQKEVTLLMCELNNELTDAMNLVSDGLNEALGTNDFIQLDKLNCWDYI